MTPQDIIKKGKVAVRNSGTLYPLYKSLFFEAFGREAECPTCGSAQGKADWNSFTAYANGADPETLNNNTTNMAKPTFVIKKKAPIYRYQNEGERVQRVYGDVMSEDFAIKYLENAENDPELLAKRKAEFSVLPEKFRDEVEVIEEDDKTKLPTTLKDLKALAVERGYPEDEYKDIKKIVDMDAYVRTKEAVEDFK